MASFIAEKYTLSLPENLISADLLKRFLSLYDSLISQGGLSASVTEDTDTEENLTNLLAKKLIHSIAAIGYFEKVLKAASGRELSDDTIRAVLLFELTQVDIADTLAEIPVLRTYRSQIKLFEALKCNAIYGESRDLFDMELLVDVEFGEKLTSWQNYAKILCTEYYKTIHKYSLWNTVTDIVDRRLTEYYFFILGDHVKVESEIAAAREWLSNNTFFYSETNWKCVPDWVKERDLWFNFLGDSISFLVPLFLVIEFDSRVQLNVIKDILAAFRGVGILNVWLDDLLDVEEDNVKGDTNLYNEIHQGRYDEDLFGIGNITHDEAARRGIFIDKIISLISEDFARISNAKNKKLIDAHVLILTAMPELYLFMGKMKGIDDDRLVILDEVLKKATKIYAEYIHIQT